MTTSRIPDIHNTMGSKENGSGLNSGRREFLLKMGFGLMIGGGVATLQFNQGVQETIGEGKDYDDLLDDPNYLKTVESALAASAGAGIINV